MLAHELRRSRDFHQLLLGSRVLARVSRYSLPICLLLVALIAICDSITGYEMRLGILYLVPIAWSTWSMGRAAGVLVSLLAAMSWVASFQESHRYSRDLYYYWEAGLTVTTYFIFVGLLARLREALQSADRRFVTVLDSLDAAVFVQAPGGGVLFANRRFRDVFGGSALPQLPGAAGPAPVELRHEETNRWYYVQSRPLHWIDGRIATLRVLTDISEEKRARELIRKHRDAVHKTSRLVALGEFASAIAHELNQPLAAIATYSNACLRMLRSGQAAGAELADAMDKCRQQAKRAGDIIARLRGFLRQPSAARTQRDLADVLLAASRLAEPEAAEAGVRIDVDLAADAPPVPADPVLIEQAVLNLLRNAIDAVRGEPAARRRVTVASRAGADGSVSVCVSDMGPGIPAEVREHLFEPFYTTKADGLGLGLSICRSVIEAHGGRLGYEPAARGSAFSFVLPRSRA